MTKLPPYQPTTLHMLAQAKAAQLAQQQAFHQSQLYSQQQLANQSQMTMYPPPSQPMGAANGRYRNTNQTTSSSSAGPAYIAHMGANGTITYYPVCVTTNSVATCQPISAPAFEEAGIRAGEIIGYRAWYLRSGDELGSVYMPYVWQPGVQRIGDERVNRHMGNGFHAFKDMDQCRREYPGYNGVVYGEVALWGEVYEHERGYRAEWARVTRIIEVCENNEPPWIRFWRRPTIHKLCSKYGVVE